MSEADGTSPGTRRMRLGEPALPLGVAALALLIGAWQPGPVVTVVDEELWLARSDAFADALFDGRLSDMTAAGSAEGATMPGVTTMWVGTAARTIGGGLHAIGVLDEPLGPMATSATGLRVAHLVMATVTALLIGLVVVLVRRLAGPVVGGATGVLLAVEPFVASNGLVLHTDSLVALPALVSFLCLLLAVSDTGRSRASIAAGWAAASGAAWGVAVLTKVNAAALLPGLVPIGLWWAWTQRQRGRRQMAAHLARGAGMWVAGAVGVAVVAWPALWAAPGAQVDAVRASLELGVAVEPSPFTRSFYRGEVVPSPPATFYLVALVVRASPWLLLGAGAGLIVGTAKQVVRPLVVLTVLAPLPYLLAISWAFKKFDRYGLPVVPFLALLGGVAAGAAYEAWSARRPASGRGPVAAAIVVTAVLAIPVVAARPHAHAWVNPMVGDARATELVLRGRGEGLELAGQRIAELESGRCDDVRVAVRYKLPTSFPCGELRQPGIGFSGEVDYVVVYLNQRQRGYESGVTTWAEERGELVLTVAFGGVEHVWLYAMPRIPYPA